MFRYSLNEDSVCVYITLHSCVTSYENCCGIALLAFLGSVNHYTQSRVCRWRGKSVWWASASPSHLLLISLAAFYLFTCLISSFSLSRQVLSTHFSPSLVSFLSRKESSAGVSQLRWAASTDTSNTRRRQHDDHLLKASCPQADWKWSLCISDMWNGTGAAKHLFPGGSTAWCFSNMLMRYITDRGMLWQHKNKTHDICASTMIIVECQMWCMPRWLGFLEFFLKDLGAILCSLKDDVRAH